MLPNSRTRGTAVLPQSFRKLLLLSQSNPANWVDSSMTETIFQLLAAIRCIGVQENLLLNAKQALAIIGEVDEKEFSAYLEDVDGSRNDDFSGFKALFNSMVTEGDVVSEQSIEIGRLPFDMQIRLKPVYRAVAALSAIGALGQKSSVNSAVPASCVILEAFTLLFKFSHSKEDSSSYLSTWLAERGCAKVVFEVFSNYALLRSFSASAFHRFNSLESVSAFAIWVIAHHKANGIVLNHRAREACTVLLAGDFLK